MKKNALGESAKGWILVFTIFGALILVGFVVGVEEPGPIRAGIKWTKDELPVENAREIAEAMRAYAVDHHGTYPDGKTSTEVFQKLLDGKYVTDPAIFYLDMPGKTEAISHTLTADNVCFDVTAGVTVDSPGQLPVVYCSGYSVSYGSGSAIRDVATPTPFPGSSEPYPYSESSVELRGAAVAFKSCDSRFLDADMYGVIKTFTSNDFNHGKQTFRQLKP